MAAQLALVSAARQQPPPAHFFAHRTAFGATGAAGAAAASTGVSSAGEQGHTFAIADQLTRAGQRFGERAAATRFGHQLRAVAT